MQIITWGDGRHVNTSHRCFEPAHALRERGHDVLVLRDGDGAQTDVLPPSCDVLLVHRLHSANVQRAARTLTAAGSAFVWDNDDDLTDVPPNPRGSVKRGGLRSQQTASELSAAIGLADLVTTPSSDLAERFRAGGAPAVTVVENYVPDAFARIKRPEHDGVTIGWVAGYEHIYDLRELRLRDSLRRLLDTREDVRVVSIGLDLSLERDRYRYMPMVRYADLPRLTAEWDVGIAPLADVSFNRARSNCKLKEYAAVGTPWLASPVGPYLGLGEREGGLLVADSDWGEALQRLVDSPRERAKLGKRGRKWARSHAMSRNVKRWEAALSEAVERRRSRR
ncbi:MAG TPA: glycosyltransferase [Conexibacter sp.]|nr:glycosyltransferase [Conexibacter sp.]